MIQVALYQPDIPPNVGTILRLGACLDVTVHIIEPASFAWNDKSLRRAGLDYLDHVRIVRQPSYQAFCAATSGHRQVLLTTKSEMSYISFAFRSDDILVLGRESSGVSEEVRRSLNVAIACAMVLGEALRQTGQMQM